MFKQNTTMLNIVTFNMEGAKSNALFTRKALASADLVCLQEHWLYSFEKSKLEDLLPQWKW